jgi:hypothetical protein
MSPEKMKPTPETIADQEIVAIIRNYGCLLPSLTESILDGRAGKDCQHLDPTYLDDIISSYE